MRQDKVIVQENKIKRDAEAQEKQRQYEEKQMQQEDERQKFVVLISIKFVT